MTHITSIAEVNRPSNLLEQFTRCQMLALNKHRTAYYGFREYTQSRNSVFLLSHRDTGLDIQAIKNVFAFFLIRREIRTNA